MAGGIRRPLARREHQVQATEPHTVGLRYHADRHGHRPGPAGRELAGRAGAGTARTSVGASVFGGVLMVVVAVVLTVTV